MWLVENVCAGSAQEILQQAKKEATCSGCATCTGTLDDCPLDLFVEKTKSKKKKGL